MKKKLLPTLLAMMAMIIGWQIIAFEIGYPAIFPSVKDLFLEVFLVFRTPEFYSAVSSTIARGIVGFAFSLILAFALSSIAAFFDFWKSFFHPIIVVMRSIPVISFVLLAILWFSPTTMPVFIALLTMLPILYQNILTGFEQTDIKWLEMAKVHNKRFLKRFQSIYLPASKQSIFDGMSTALGFGWRAIIIGEVLAQPLHGIGTSMKEAQAFINVPELISWTVVAVLINSFFEIMLKIFRKVDLHHKLSFMLVDYKLSNKDSQELREIKISNIEKSFNNKLIFSKLSSVFNTESVFCLKAPSGKGKTTLLRIIAGLEKKYVGNIIFPANRRIAYAFQDFRLLPWLSVSENIAYVIPRNKFTTMGKNNLVGYLIEKMELTKEANNFPSELSGGQQQRVSLARALASQSDILLLDEPLTGMDDKLKSRIIEFLDEWISCYKPIVIWATHENVKLQKNKISELFL